MQEHSDTASTGPSPSPNDADARLRGWWFFPLGVLAVAGVLIAAAMLSRATPDYKAVFSIILVVVSYLLLIGWVGLYAPMSRAKRWSAAAAMVLLAAAPFAAYRPEFDGDMALMRFMPRWSAPADAALDTARQQGTADLSATTAWDYTQFLGPDRHPVVEGVRLATDWESNPPELLWRQPIGAGSSGFAVVGRFAVTQEQRGDNEMVICYEVPTGKVVWTRSDSGRFISVMGGDGPRATPTIDDGKVYTLGATGVLNCLDGATGKLIWQHDILEENGAANLEWGISGSPLVVEGLVIVSAGAPDGKSLLAYEKESGELAWSGGSDVASYASPALATLGGERQVLMVNQDYVVGHRLTDGEVLWRHAWPGKSNANASASQPVVVPGDRVLLSKGYGIGCTLLKIEHGALGEWQATAVWDPPVLRHLKTKLTNVAVRDGLVFGLDGGILQCVELDSGKSLWKGGRYGHGQIILVGEVLLVTAESGEVALVEASGEQYRELTRFQAIEGRTWNNPALSGAHLLVRNHLEAACYVLPLKDQATLAGR
ncbi:MAG: PQQ-binding-like beta-propeller repeat protein [Pirellulales bacterium]